MRHVFFVDYSSLSAPCLHLQQPAAILRVMQLLTLDRCICALAWACGPYFEILQVKSHVDSSLSHTVTIYTFFFVFTPYSFDVFPFHSFTLSQSTATLTDF